jgi:hypothetical protein
MAEGDTVKWEIFGWVEDTQCVDDGGDIGIMRTASKDVSYDCGDRW